MNAIILILWGIWIGFALSVYVELKREVLEKIFGAISLMLFGRLFLWGIYGLIEHIFSFL